MDLNELNVKFDTNGEHLMLEVINYISSGSPKIASIGLLRDGESLIKIISLFERQTRWQSTRVIDLFFKYKNEVITSYQFIDGWLENYYTSGQVLVADGFRYATNQDVMIIALLVLNVLYVKRDSLTYDLKTRLEALWIDFNSTVDSIIIWLRTRAQLIDSNIGLHSSAHQLFSGQSLFEYQSIQQRLTQMVQQKLINEQMKTLDEKDLIIRKQSKEFSELGIKMLEMVRELNDFKKQNAVLTTEVKWQMSANNELNQTIAKLRHENKVLKKLALKDNALLKDIMDNTGADRTDPMIASFEIKSESTDDSNSGSVVDNNSDENESKQLPNGCAVDYDSNRLPSERNDDSDSLTEIEDITDSGNHSDAATDDLLLEIYSNGSPKEENNTKTGNEETKEAKDGVFSWNSWQEFFANDSNNDHHLNDNNSDKKVQNNDTYNTSNHSLGTNDNRISALILN